MFALGRRREAELRVAPEPIREIWLEAKPLAEAHFEEVDGGVEARRGLHPDLDMMEELQRVGVLLVLGARELGALVGYITWQIAPDVESLGLTLAAQGAWFVPQGKPRVALELYNTSLRLLRERGVHYCLPHHRMQGRGVGLGKFFLRLGAKPIQQTYMLWLQET